MTMTLNEFIAAHQARIEDALRAQVSSLPSHNTRLIEAIRYSLLDGGKRIRPMLCYAAAQAISEVQSSTDAFACALECIHVYSLIHDDLPAMDDDALRRGKPTCHIAFDEATAILAGDALQCLAFEIIGAANCEDRIKVSAVQCLAKASGASGMVIGQAIDLHAVNTQPSVTEMENMHRHKTGALINAAVKLGAISAGANDAQLNALNTYSCALGLAFQVQDDVLDIISDTQTLGKTQGSDHERNKPTYVSLLGLEGAQAKALSLRDEAVAALAQFNDKGATLRALADFVVERRY